MRSDIAFAAMDGEVLDIEGPFDLIVSSLAFQWFADLPRAIGRLAHRLAPGGHLVFTTMAAGSFAEWRAAHDGLASGTPDYPGADGLCALAGC